MLVLVSGCTVPPPTPAPRPVVGLSELLEQPAERALYEAMRAYDEGQYAASETALRRALDAGLRSARDRATAYKLIGFIACAGQRLEDCESAFVAARAADPGFDLSRSEAGHPVWGPVWKRVASSR